MKYYIGVDLGGTGIKAGIVDENGTILHKNSCPTRVDMGYETIVADMAQLVDQVLQESGHSMDDIQAVGVGIPGVVDPRNGVVPLCSNLNWRRVPLMAELKKYFTKPLYVDNDATVAAMAEAVSGVSAGVANSVFLILGTGVGGGIILNGKVYSGAHGVGSEIGHTVMNMDGVPCPSGTHRGCIDRYGSATALIRMGKEAAARHPESKLNQMETFNAKQVMDLAREQDVAAVEAFEEYTDCLAVAMLNIINFIDPEVIVIGGGVSGAGEFLLEPIRRKLKDMIFFPEMPYAEIKQAKLGNDAGIIGAAMLGRD